MKLNRLNKCKSLAFEIWIVFAGVIVGIFILLTLLFSISLRSFFTNEVYNTIEVAQKDVLSFVQGRVKKNAPFDSENFEHYDVRAVSHVIYPFDYYDKINRMLHGNEEIKAMADKIIYQYKNQSKVSERYEIESGKSKIFYVITKYSYNGIDGFVFSFMWDTYRNNLLKNLLLKLMQMMVIALLISLAASIGLSKYLSSSIRILETNVKDIAQKNWDKPVVLERKDEIGNLSQSIEYMRQELVKRDEKQQWMLQRISHQLKTPVTVIRSYVQSVQDGIYPKGDFESTMQVIDSEAERLQKGIKNLLYLTKLEYMAKYSSVNENINLKELIQFISEKFIIQSTYLKWNTELDEVHIEGDKDQWTVVIENILDNALRYAKENIDITLQSKQNGFLLCIHNDGEPIEEKNIEKFFVPFEKGHKGNFGLGLSIVRQIVELYGGKVWAVNENGGVSFYINYIEDFLSCSAKGKL